MTPGLGIGLGLGIRSKGGAAVPFILGGTHAQPGGTALNLPMSAAAIAAGCNPVHPSPVYVPNGKFGYKWWLAYSPFNGTDVQYETPHVVASNDLINWTPPSGGVGEIEPNPTTGNFAHPNICWDGQQFICSWLWNLYTSNRSKWVFKTSTNGVTWSSLGTIYEKETTTKRPVSLSMHKVGSQYWAWWVDIAATNALGSRNYFVVIAKASEITGPWTQTQCVLDPDIVGEGNEEPWHLSVVKNGPYWVMLLACKTQGGHHTNYAAISSDGISWSIDPTPFLGYNDSTTDPTQYKSGIVLRSGLGGAGTIGLMFHGSNTFLEPIKTTPIVLNNEFPWDIEACVAKAIAGEDGFTHGDRFQRADTAWPNGLGTMPTGQTWGSYNRSPEIKSQQAARNPDFFSVARLTAASTDYIVGIRLAVLPTAGHVGVRLRGVIDTEYFFFGLSSRLITVYKWVSGVKTILMQVCPVDFIPSGHDGWSFIASVVGTEFNFYLNQRLMGQFTDSSNSSGVLIGFEMNDTTTRVDRFFAKVIP
jgi:hypothetical protein